MKRFWMASALGALSLTGSAMAADIGDNGIDWTGLSGSGYIGYAAVDASVSTDLNPTHVTGNSTDTGAAFGIGLGYDVDLGNIVLGLDTDVSALSIDGQLKNSLSADYDWFATGRLKAGLDLGNTMIYGTGGVALMDTTLKGGNSDNKTMVGWTVGVGAEHKLNETWSLKAEFLYADFGKQNFNTGFSTDLDAQTYMGRVGLSYWFN